MKTSKRWLVTALAVIVLGTVVVGVAMAANSPTAASSQQNTSQTFLNNLASALNITPAALTSALKTASTQTVDQELQNGKLTQQQANQILAKINSGKFFCGFMGMGFGRHQSVSGAVYGNNGGFMGPGSGNSQSVAGSVYGKHSFHRGPGAMGGFTLLKPLASALGVNQKDLMSDLRSGQTISALAAAKSLTVTQIESTILSSIKSQLDQQVQSGKLTQDKENQIYNNLQQSIDSGAWITQLQNVGHVGGHRQHGSRDFQKSSNN